MKKRILALLTAILFILPLCPAGRAEGEYSFSTMNAYATENGVKKLRRISIPEDSDPVLVEKISTYHWNGGKGTNEPGTISMVECVKTDGKWKVGQTLGTWQARGEDAGKDAKNAYWTVYPNFTMEPGHHYAVKDSDTDTWSSNSASDGYGMFEITGRYLDGSEEVELPVDGDDEETAQGGGSQTVQTQEEPQNMQAAVNQHLEQIPGETDRVKVRLQGVNAHTYIKNKQNPNKWAPQNAVDGDESTCWQYTAKKGAWLELDIGAAEAVDEIWFKNGFWAYNDKGKDQYSINARPKAVKVQFLYSGESKFRDETDITLRDEWNNGWQQFSLGHHENVAAVKIVINSTYKGSHYAKDVCLSEVMLVQHESAQAAMPAQEAKAATVYESRPDVTGCSLTMKLATRSGPGTQYAEPGTFFGNNWQNQTVRVLKKSYDGSIWWVQVDFRNGTKKNYRVWTGVKRVDVNLDQVKEEIPIGDCEILPTSDTYFGPGGNYAKANISIKQTTDGNLYQIENGYADVDFYGSKGIQRCWVPQSAVINVDTSKDRSGEN